MPYCKLLDVYAVNRRRRRAGSVLYTVRILLYESNGTVDTDRGVEGLAGRTSLAGSGETGARRGSQSSQHTNDRHRQVEVSVSSTSSRPVVVAVQIVGSVVLRLSCI
ncbi:hypothetical protein J6590_073130 [Homalodisca vitripennis]|nr:hypothetical protein J6590_073130 [Homalodisca vitripennis]